MRRRRNNDRGREFSPACIFVRRRLENSPACNNWGAKSKSAGGEIRGGQGRLPPAGAREAGADVRRRRGQSAGDATLLYRLHLTDYHRAMRATVARPAHVADREGEFGW